jgi:hypothetical protein
MLRSRYLQIAFLVELVAKLTDLFLLLEPDKGLQPEFDRFAPGLDHMQHGTVVPTGVLTFFGGGESRREEALVLRQ